MKTQFMKCVLIILGVTFAASPVCTLATVANLDAKSDYDADDLSMVISAAAIYAIRMENLELMEELQKKFGWNPSLPFGYIPGKFDIRQNAATNAALGGKLHVLRWLKESRPGVFDERDGYRDRPIDVVLHQMEGKGLLRDEALYHRCLEIVSKDRVPEDVDAREVLFVAAHRKAGNSHLIIRTVNDEVPDKTWQEAYDQFVESAAVAPAIDENHVEFVQIQWEMENEFEYKFRASISPDDPIERPTALGGGGVSGIIRFKHGYWITEEFRIWDS